MDEPRKQFFAVIDRAKALGARVVEHQPQPARLVVMLGLAGHPFCLSLGR